MKRNSVHFSSQVPINETSVRMELRHMFKHLISDPSTRTADTLRTIRKSLKRSGNPGIPPDRDKNEYFELFYELLNDQRWRIVCECTMLMVDLIPQMSELELDHCMSLVLPRVIPNLGHSSTDVRRASLRLLHVYMRYTNNLQKVLRLYIKYGLQNREKPSQKGAVLSLPLLFTEEFANENLFLLVDALAELLVSTDTTLFYPVFLALQRIHSLVGKETFRVYLDHVRQEAVLLYQRVLSRNNSLATSIGGRSETVDLSLQPPEGDSITSIDRLIGYSEAPSSFVTREDELTSRYAFGLCYGIFPKLLVRRAESESLPERLDALSQMVMMVQESPQTQVHILSQHFGDFLRNFISDLIESNSYKITLYAYDLLESSIERLKMSAIDSLNLITSLLLKRLGDSRVVVREYNIKVLYRIMFSLPPQMILDSLLEHKFHRNPKVREEILNRISAGVMMFPRSEFNLPRLINHVSPLLLDSKRCVRIAALETISVLGQSLGPSNIDILYRAVRSLELTRAAPGLFNAVQARLLRHELPKCSPDGTIKHYINRLTCATWIPQECDADMEWAMMGTINNYPDMTSSRNAARRKSSIVLPQVSFEEATSDSTEVVKKGTNWTNRKASVADVTASEDVKIKQDRTERKKPIASPESSSASDSTKERELWRYYFMSFQRNLEPWKSDEAVNSRGNIRPNSVSSNTSCDSAPRTTRSGLLDADFDAKNQRALSMPTIASGNLSDISEQSHEDIFSRGRMSRNRRRSSHRLPNSEPSSPERRLSIVDTLCIGPRSKSVAGRVPTPDSKPHETLPLPNVSSPRRGSNASIQSQKDGDDDESKEPVSANSDVTIVQGNIPNATVGGNTDHTVTNMECGTNQEAQQGEESYHQRENIVESKRDAQTQMYESDSSNGCFVLDHHHYHARNRLRDQTRFQTVPARRKCCRKYISRSKSPRRELRYHTRIQPAIASNIDIYGILENVAKTEGAFVSPEDALKAVIAAFSQDAWTTKVEAMLAITRLATYHPSILQRELHTIVQALVYEVKNLRSTVSRSAIYTLGDLLTKMKRSIEPESDMIAQALLHKCSENTTFIRDDIDKALMALVDEMPQTKAILSLIHGGAHHRSVAVRKTAAHYISLVVDKMGANKCLVGPRDVAEHLLPAAAKFVMDPSPVTRFYGRSIFYTVQSHPQFEKLMRKHILPGTYRNIHGVLESLKRRGPGEKPSETAIKAGT